jgi:plasmid stability protein
MGELLVRNVDDDVVEELRHRASNAGLSLEEQDRRIPHDAVRPARAEILADMARSRAMTPAGQRIPAEVLIREDRDTR